MTNNKKFYDVRELKDLRDLIYQSEKLYADRPAFEVKNSKGEHFEEYFRLYCRSSVVFAVIWSAYFIDETEIKYFIYFS